MGTYYGDISYENVGGVVTDAAGNIYFGGSSGSPSGIATPGAHQTIIGMQYNPDGMIVKLNSAGVRQWGTYYGGSTEDYVSCCLIAANGDLYVAGYSNSPAGAGGIIATANGYQPINAGFGDAFLARFTTAGVRLYGTYYGENNNDVAYAIASDVNNTIYVAGLAASGPGTTFASTGCHQAVYGGGQSDAFLVQFSDCTAPASPVNVTPPANQSICTGHSATLTATAGAAINWFTTATSVQSIGTGASFISPVLNTGMVTYYAETTSTCSSGGSRTPFTITVYALPVVNINGTNICTGQTTTITATGASQYSWNTGASGAALSISPSATTSYTVTGTSAQGCVNTASITIAVSPMPATNATATRTLICKGEPVTITATGASIYSWNTASSSSVIVVNPSNTITYTVVGSSATGGCTNMASITISVSACAGINNISGVDLAAEVYPNPTHGLVTVNASTPSEIKVTNAIGQVILQKKAENSAVIDLSTFTTGIYVFEIKQAQRIKVLKIVKE